MGAPAPSGARRLIVRAAGRAIGLDASEVSEVARTPALTPVPLAPPALRGLASLRGKVAPVVSLAALLGEPEAGGDARRMVVLRRAEPIALAVDSIDAARGETEDVELADLDALLREAFTAARRPQARALSTTAAAPQAARPVERRQGILSFMIAGQAYGLPLANVREVFRAPPDLLRLQDADEVALGVISHREGVLPVISPAPLLGLGGAGLGGRSSIVVAGLGSAAVGLLVDSVRSVVRVSEADLKPVPAVLNRGRAEAEIQAIARTSEGLVALLSPDRLFDHRTVAQVLDQTPAEAAPMSDAQSSESAPFVIFRLGSQSYGLPAAAVIEVVNLPDVLQPPPGRSKALAGVMNHRGAALAVIDPAVRMGLETGERRRRRVLVLETEGQRCGLIVDAVEQLTRVETDRLTETTELAEAGARIFHRAAIVELDSRPVLFVDPEALLEDVQEGLAGDLDAAGKAAGA